MTGASRAVAIAIFVVSALAVKAPRQLLISVASTARACHAPLVLRFFTTPQAAGQAGVDLLAPARRLSLLGGHKSCASQVAVDKGRFLELTPWHMDFAQVRVQEFCALKRLPRSEPGRATTCMDWGCLQQPKLAVIKPCALVARYACVSLTAAEKRAEGWSKEQAG